MHFGNNIEKYGFEKSTWPMVAIIDKSDGIQEIYMGRCQTGDPDIKATGWLVRKITITTIGSVTTIVTEQTKGWDNIWKNYESLEYHLI